MIELEKTYLAKYIPEGLINCKKKEIIDIYIPASEEHPILRIRKDGNRYEITKKVPIDGDASKQEEYTINLTESEWQTISKLDGRRTHKMRYFYSYKHLHAEFDVFLDKKAGLVVVDFEFADEDDKEAFEMPDFCLADITHEDFIAGGMICGKSYDDIKDKLEIFNYKQLNL